MRRYTFYLSVALLAFGIGSFVVFKFYWITDGKQIVAEEKQVADKTRNEKGFGIGFGSGTGTGYATANKQTDKPAYISKITCSNEKLLPVWNELKKDKQFRERAKEFYMSADCSEMLDVQNVDLSGDGQNEFVLWGRNGNLCGGTGNCDMWIYEKKNGKYKQMLQSNAYNYGEEKGFEVNKVKSNGYRNILLKGHASGYEITEHFYEFNSKQYKETKCLFVSYFLSDKEPSIKSCEEAWKR